METVVFDKKQSEEIIETLKKGGLVALMTDTVYGLAALSNIPKLYHHLAAVKNRPPSKPFPLMAASIEQIESIAIVSERDKRLITKFMPGPVTFIFKKKEGVFPYLDEQDTIGIRIANGEWLQNIIQSAGAPLWLPSANLSNYPTALNSTMVLEQLDGLIEGVVRGEAPGGVSSSVFDLSQKEIVCLREGPISLETLLKEA